MHNTKMLNHLKKKFDDLLRSEFVLNVINYLEDDYTPITNTDKAENVLIKDILSDIKKFKEEDFPNLKDNYNNNLSYEEFIEDHYIEEIRTKECGYILGIDGLLKYMIFTVFNDITDSFSSLSFEKHLSDFITDKDSITVMLLKNANPDISDFCEDSLKFYQAYYTGCNDLVEYLTCKNELINDIIDYQVNLLNHNSEKLRKLVFMIIRDTVIKYQNEK